MALYLSTKNKDTIHLNIHYWGELNKLREIMPCKIEGNSHVMNWKISLIYYYLKFQTSMYIIVLFLIYVCICVYVCICI